MGLVSKSVRCDLPNGWLVSLARAVLQKPGVQSLIAEASGAKADVQLKHGDTVSMGAVQVRCDRPVGSGVEGWGQGHGRCERLQATGWC